MNSTTYTSFIKHTAEQLDFRWQGAGGKRLSDKDLVDLRNALMDFFGPRRPRIIKTDDPFGVQLNKIYKKVQKFVGPDAVVAYSAYIEKNDLPVDNLDQKPITGKVVFRATAGRWPGKDYKSPVVESPTWLEICKLADDMIRIVNDFHHVYLEGVKVESKKGGIKYARFDMGS